MSGLAVAIAPELTTTTCLSSFLSSETKSMILSKFDSFAPVMELEPTFTMIRVLAEMVSDVFNFPLLQ